MTTDAPPAAALATGGLVRPGSAAQITPVGHGTRVARITLALATGLVVAGTTVVLRLWAPGHGNATLVVAVLLALAMPTSRALSRRALLSGAFFFGFTPVLWWTKLPLGDVGRAGLLLSLLAGGLAMWLTAGGWRAVPRRARALLPRLSVIDAVPVLAAGASAWVASGWFRVRSAPAALAVLLPGWDNSAHFDMVQMLLRHGTTVDQLGKAPLGESWQFAQYPQGYHAVVATIIETTGTTTATDPAAALVSYVHAETWVVVLIGGLLAAAVCSLPALRRRPALALPAAGLLVAGFVTGPGAAAFVGGFPNFVVACALTACVPLLVAMTPRVPMPLHVAAIGALLAGVANSWILLLAIAGPAAVVVALPATRSRWRGTRRAWVTTAVVLLVTALAVVAPLRVLDGLDAGDVLVIPGGINSPDLGFVVAVALAGTALCLWGLAGSRPVAHARHAVAPLAGLAAAAAVGLWQIHSAGALSYYFYKLMIGVELVSLSVVVLGLSGLATGSPTRTARQRRDRGANRTGRVVAVLAATLAATQLTGLTPGAHRVFAIPAPIAPATSEIVAAAAEPVTAPRATLLIPGGTGTALQAQQWYLALTGRWTTEANDAATRALLDVADAATTTPTLLDQVPGAVVLVDPATVENVRRSVGGAERADRVLGW
ncbi:MAG TPA: hypothetical protein VGC04_13065 [Cellulomonas sp.]